MLPMICVLLLLESPAIVDGEYRYHSSDTAYDEFASPGRRTYKITLRRDTLTIQNGWEVGVGTKDRHGCYPLVWFAGGKIFGYETCWILANRKIVGYLRMCAGDAVITGKYEMP